MELIIHIIKLYGPKDAPSPPVYSLLSNIAFNANGFLENLAKEAAINLAKSAGKFAVDKGLELGGNFVKGKIEGLGMRRKRTATPAQLAALAKGRAIRDANRYGGALYAAGY